MDVRCAFAQHFALPDFSPCRPVVDERYRARQPAPAPIAYFTDVRRKSGLTMVNVFGGTELRSTSSKPLDRVGSSTTTTMGGLTSSW